jgi:hypothetical protein
MRVLLVTDDDGFGGGLEAAAADRDVTLARASTTDDLDTTAIRHQPNVVALDGRSAPARFARSAVAFATLHPRLAVVLVVDCLPPTRLGDVGLVEGKRSPESLLDALERARVGLTPAPRSDA